MNEMALKCRIKEGTMDILKNEGWNNFMFVIETKN